MKIRTELAYPPNNWTAVDDETYSGPGSPIGRGTTENEAVEDLFRQIEAKDGPTYSEIRDRYNLDRSYGMGDD